MNEKALIIEALIAIGLLYYFVGFELTVLSSLAVITGHVFKISYHHAPDKRA